ncbi:DnaA initiator-associating protein [Aeromonas sp. RU39B]|jgi:DnaA initiator-associating protein|uniref:D-sedoheptulose-7-phosphate isomerase n=1 Tax=Aeromonas sp. RU39B TaxID=1907416 RepID=UPI000955EAF6|nr:SIS domain-containing protein [Aeromonas sp. RU39B]SIQ47058.1 DnaA initiator-associating protein [Aeromonas sp. RU39B]
MTDRIKENYTESIQTKIAAAEGLHDAIHTAAQMITICLLNGNKVLSCGNGPSAALAQLFIAELMNRYETERPSLPGLALTPDMATISAIATDTGFEEVYAKQIRALGQPGDILLAVTTSGHSRSLIKAAEAALSRDMTIVVLSGGDGGEIAGLLGPNDVEIRVPSARSPRILEVHLLTLHCLCDLIDQTLFPQQED